MWVSVVRMRVRRNAGTVIQHQLTSCEYAAGVAYGDRAPKATESQLTLMEPYDRDMRLSKLGRLPLSEWTSQRLARSKGHKFEYSSNSESNDDTIA